MTPIGDLIRPRGTKRAREEDEKDDEDDEADEDQDDELSFRVEGVTEAEQSLIQLYLYRAKSGRELNQLRPDVWTTHGTRNRKYKHLANKITKEKKGPGGANGRVTNQPWVLSISSSISLSTSLLISPSISSSISSSILY